MSNFSHLAFSLLLSFFFVIILLLNFTASIFLSIYNFCVIILTLVRLTFTLLFRKITHHVPAA